MNGSGRTAVTLMGKTPGDSHSVFRSVPLNAIGVTFLLGAALIALLLRQPIKAQYFVLYALVELGIALLLTGVPAMQPSALPSGT